MLTGIISAVPMNFAEGCEEQELEPRASSPYRRGGPRRRDRSPAPPSSLNNVWGVSGPQVAAEHGLAVKPFVVPAKSMSIHTSNYRPPDQASANPASVGDRRLTIFVDLWR